MADLELTQTQPCGPEPSVRPASAPEVAVRARLVSLTSAGVVFALTRDQKEVHVGRHPECQIVVSDKRVSGRHLRIYCDEEQRYFVQELSANGCYLNEHFLSKNDTRVLQNGDTVSLCVKADEPRHEDEQMRTFAAWVFRVVDHAAVEASAKVGAEADKHFLTEAQVKDRWDTRTVIGSGNFSEVRLGLRVKTGESFAVKVIDIKKFQTFQNKRESHLSLSSEAEVLTSLQNTGIVQFYEWFQTTEKLYLVMEYMRGGDLLQCILEQGCFSELQARRLFRQLCEAVRYLHHKGFVHRDLKPENILLTTKDRDSMHMKIADFGLARKTMKSRDCGTFCGTPHYFAPEVINTFRDKNTGVRTGYDKQADMWSLGVILYIMLSGIPPFEEEGLYEQILEGKYEFDVSEWISITPEAKELVRSLMTVNPKSRKTIDQALEHINERWIVRSVSPDERRKLSPSPNRAEVQAAKRRRTNEAVSPERAEKAVREGASVLSVAPVDVARPLKGEGV